MYNVPARTLPHTDRKLRICLVAIPVHQNSRNMDSRCKAGRADFGQDFGDWEGPLAYTSEDEHKSEDESKNQSECKPVLAMAPTRDITPAKVSCVLSTFLASFPSTINNIPCRV